MLSYADIGSAAMLSRAVAGLVRDSHLVVFALPGSPAAVGLGLSKLILPSLATCASRRGDERGRNRARGRGQAKKPAAGLRLPVLAMASVRASPRRACRRALHDGEARPISYVRISLTDRCNYRCTYCMPAEGVDPWPRATS